MCLVTLFTAVCSLFLQFNILKQTKLYLKKMKNFLSLFSFLEVSQGEWILEELERLHGFLQNVAGHCLCQFKVVFIIEPTGH